MHKQVEPIRHTQDAACVSRKVHLVDSSLSLPLMQIVEDEAAAVAAPAPGEVSVPEVD